MGKLTRKAYEEIKRWMYRNARPLELMKWQYYFENGSKEAVMDKLQAFQNEDGGFGNALEPDNWNPESNPGTIYQAITVLEELKWEDSSHPVIQDLLRFLESGTHRENGLWGFSIPSNDKYPSAPWWKYSKEANTLMGYNPTAVLVGFILRYADKASDLYQEALQITKGIVEKINGLEKADMHELGCFAGLYEDLKDLNLLAQFDSGMLKQKLSKLVNASIERDPAKWPVYSVRPSTFIRTPDSDFYSGNEEVVEKEVAYILSSRTDGGVWDISWQWADYPSEFRVSTIWWQAYWAISNLLFLKSFDALDF